MGAFWGAPTLTLHQAAVVGATHAAVRGQQILHLHLWGAGGPAQGGLPHTNHLWGTGNPRPAPQNASWRMEPPFMGHTEPPSRPIGHPSRPIEPH